MTFPKELEVILARHLASCLITPMLIVDPTGTLIYLNESAEQMMGQPHEKIGMSWHTEWWLHYEPTDENGNALSFYDLPVSKALKNQVVSHDLVWFNLGESQKRCIQMTAIPLVGEIHRFLGLLVILEILKQAS